MKKNNKKSILLMNPWQEYMLGSEIFSLTLAEEFMRLGHRVDAFTFLKKTMWAFMQKAGVKLLEDEVKDKYDLVIMSGNPCIGKAPKSAYKIMISHGVIPPQEYPVEGADRYVAVSEEVYRNVRNKGYDPVLIRNGIDCDKFKSTKPVHKKLKNVLLISNKDNPQTPFFRVLDKVCQEMRLRLSVCGLQFGTSQWQDDLVEHINNNDLIISLGRGVYESMACERNVIAGGYQGLDGWFDRKTYLEARKNNCSGRRFKRVVSVESLINEFRKYDPKQGKVNRDLILKDHDIKKIAENYLNLYKYRHLNI